MSDDAPLEKLEQPPIVEVICGVWFANAVELDPVVLGAYWLRRRADFPKHEIHPPITTALAELTATPPMPLEVEVQRFSVNTASSVLAAPIP